MKGIEEVRDYKASRARSGPPPCGPSRRNRHWPIYPHPGAVEMTQAEWKRTHADQQGHARGRRGARQAGFFRPELQDRTESKEHGRHRVRTVARVAAPGVRIPHRCQDRAAAPAAETQEAAG